MQLFNRIKFWARGSRGLPAKGQAHMTFGATSVGRTLTRTSLFLKKQLWIWPIIAVVLLAIVGYLVSISIHTTMENTLRSELTTLLSVERSMLEKWLKVQEATAGALANDLQIRKSVLQLLAAKADAARNSNAEAPQVVQQKLSDLHAEFVRELEPGLWSQGFVGFVLADKQQQIVGAYTAQLIGQTIPQYEAFLTRALDGKPTVSAPFPSVVMLKDKQGKMRTGTPTMFVAAPVRDDNFQVVAVLALRIAPEKEFTDILRLGRIGDSGETYAINKDGLMVSNSRFDESLIISGLLPDSDGATSILNIQVRDPGGSILDGFRPTVRRRELPLTKSCAAVIGGDSGVDMDGYRDYRGVPVVGAWSWLPEYDIGIITEITYAEAFHPLTILRRVFFSMFALLTASSIAIFGFTLVLARMQREAQKAAIEAKQLGQYRLENQLGAGAMGVVYKGHHAMLRRPTAIKMLHVDRVNEATMARFEREVQITCKLNNPNTVAIYDYGRTPEGVFYYAMEYLDGINLQSLVEQYGPQPEGRVIRILKHMCGSLYEAHSLGLVHRDIKPANIMLNRRGGEPDVVKVLDFGLVKTLDDERGESGGLSGTPLYMSPEAIETPDLVDPRSDLYAVGAVGYYMLTGRPVFEADSLNDLLNKHVSAIPDPPSRKVTQPISPELESALMACLEKSRAKRPQTARDLMNLLLRSPLAASWTTDDADAWWGRHDRGVFTQPAAPPAAATATAARPRDTSPPPVDPAQVTAEHAFDRTIAFQPPEDPSDD